MERSSPASLGLINARTGAGLERNTAAPADQRSAQGGTPSATAPDKPASSTTGRDSDGGRWPRRRRAERPPPPWRVEGLAEQKKQQPGDGGGNWSWFWWTLLGLLVLNWILSSALLGAAARTTVPYTSFVRQGDRG